MHAHFLSPHDKVLSPVPLMISVGAQVPLFAAIIAVVLLVSYPWSAVPDHGHVLRSACTLAHTH